MIRGGPESLTLTNTLVAAALFFLCHDLLWAPLHRLFHSHGALYKAFHKFHHKQVGPSVLPAIPLRSCRLLSLRKAAREVMSMD